MYINILYIYMYICVYIYMYMYKCNLYVIYIYFFGRKVTDQYSLIECGFLAWVWF